jgi:hypothetical protein
MTSSTCCPPAASSGEGAAEGAAAHRRALGAGAARAGSGGRPGMRRALVRLAGTRALAEVQQIPEPHTEHPHPPTPNPQPQPNPTQPTSTPPHPRTIQPVELDEDGRPVSDPGAPARAELADLKDSLADTQPAGSLVSGPPRAPGRRRRRAGEAARRGRRRAGGEVALLYCTPTRLSPRLVPTPRRADALPAPRPADACARSAPAGGQVQVAGPGACSGDLPRRREREDAALHGRADGEQRPRQGGGEGGRGRGRGLVRAEGAHCSGGASVRCAVCGLAPCCVARRARLAASLSMAAAWSAARRGVDGAGIGWGRAAR